LAGSPSNPWVQQTIPSDITTGHLFAIWCASSQKCWAVGSNGPSATILATTDGGQTWAAQNYPTNTGLASHGHLFSVTCGSPTACQAVGSGDQLSILSTHDGGANWVSDAYPSGLANGHLFTVFCATAATCWALGGDPTGTPVILNTTDGGQSWREQPYPSGLGLSGNGFLSIGCGNPSSCVIAANAGGTLVLLATSDGGQNWSVRPYPSSISAKTNGVGSISCPTVQACYLTGFTTSTAGGTPIILATHDGGTTWASQPYPSSLGLQTLDAIWCASGSDCWTLGSASSGPVILATSDGGSSWAPQAFPSSSGLGSNGLVGVACSGASACFIIGSGASSEPVIMGAKS
jgi:photosystem II stability/assembly factor-like uncharacterized protein